MSDSEGFVGDPIDPDTSCLACGSQDSPDTMVICDSCSQGFHLSCFGLPAIPEDDEWQCQGCMEVQRLSLGQLLVLEMPQTLYGDGQDPHFTQGLFRGTITSLGGVLPGMLRQVQLQVEDAPLPGSLAFYSSSTYKRLKRIPTATKQLAEQLYQRTGSELCTLTVASGRFGMFGSCAAAANKAAEAWLDGPNSVQQALHALAGPAKQLYLLSDSGGSSSSSFSSKTAAGAEHDIGDQQQQPVPMQTSPPPPLQQHSQQQAGISAEPYLPPNVPPATASAYMPWPLMRSSAEPHQLPNQTACPTVPWPYMVPSAQPYAVPNPAAHAAYPVAPTYGHHAPAMPVMMMPWGWPAAAAPMPGWGLPGVSFAPPPLPPGWQPVQLGGQQPPVAQGPPLAPAAPAAAAAAATACRQPRRQAVSTWISASLLKDVSGTAAGLTGVRFG